MKKYILGLVGLTLAIAGCSSSSDEEKVPNYAEGDSAQLETRTATLWRSLAKDGVAEYFTDFNENHQNTPFNAARRDALPSCSENALKMDDGTIYMDELESLFMEGSLVEGVCGKALSLKSGEVAPLGVNLLDSMKTGTVEFWFRPGEDFYDQFARTLLGNDEARMHFFMQDGELVFQKNHADQHFFVKGAVELKNDWNLIGGQWGDGFLSLWVNGELVARVEHDLGYVPSLRGVEFGNLVVIGYKSGCCMEGVGQLDAMTTSGDFDQFRISKVLRYDNGVKNVDFDTIAQDTEAVSDTIVQDTMVVNDKESISGTDAVENRNVKWVVDWEFNDSENVGKDFSGNGHDAVVYEGSVKIEDGVALFDGASGLKIEPTNDMMLKNFVVEARVFPKKIVGFNNILVTEPPGFGPDGWIFRFENGKLVFLVRDAAWGEDWKGVSYADVETEKWYEIHVEYSNDSLRMFVDGKLVAFDVIPGDFSDLKYQWGLGYDAVNQGIHNRYFNGFVDYVRVGIPNGSEQILKIDTTEQTSSVCSENALKFDDQTLYFDEMDTVRFEGTLIDGVCGKAVRVVPGEKAKTSISLEENLEVGTVEFWFRPGENFYDESSRTILGNDESRVHFFMMDGQLVFQKNHADLHFFVKGAVELKNDWNLIAGQWGDGFLSLWVNGKLVARIDHNEGYEPSARGKIDGNLIVAGYKSDCCMEGPGQNSSMVTSGDFDQVRVSKIVRYDNTSVQFEEVVESSSSSETPLVDEENIGDSESAEVVEE